MIPLHLTLSGFLSYHEPVELDFTDIELACIAGPNGAGKSSLLDAITWVLFGQARRRDEAIINNRSAAAEVCLIFTYENNCYRVQRTLPRGKSSVLEFHILQESYPFSMNGIQSAGSLNLKSAINDQKLWKPLTERTLRETQARLEQTLSLDYETFVNAAFFLQGKADLFTQQRPGDRKRILSSILGLETWETYRQRSADRRKAVEAEIAALDGRLEEIKAELAEEEARRERLEHLEADLARAAQMRALQEETVEHVRKIVATLEAQGQTVAALARNLENLTRNQVDLEARLILRQNDRQAHVAVIAREPAIRAAYAAWQQARLDLERWEAIAVQFREHEKARQGPLTEIETARASLEQELQFLRRQKSLVDQHQAELPTLLEQQAAVQETLGALQAQLDRRQALDGELQAARQRQAEARAENPRLKAEMDELKERIDHLSQAEGAVCPLCGQPLSPEDRQSLIASLTARGKEMGDRYRANRALLEQADQRVRSLENQILSLAQVEAEARTQQRLADQIQNRLEGIRKAIGDWEAEGAPRLAEIEGSLSAGTYAPQARARLAEIDSGLKAIGYDAAAHDAARRAELGGRASEEELRRLETAQAALAPLEREIADLQQQAIALQVEISRQQEEYERAAAELAARQSQAPDLYAAEAQLFDIQEQENRLRMEVGAARQKVLVLDDLKIRRKALEGEREAKARLVGHYRQLERAFGKDGVPALLIEQALPQIEAKSNEILDRLTGGNMAVRFVTQAAYKDKKREDLKETLDIQISDGSGTRDYELYSGGEGFRVNFAIRLALSEVLAKRAGARLQTLVIDEGFGSQDTQGRQRLIEAINMVRQDFSKILVITHIDELKDAFPNRIEVEKTPQGSMVRII